MGSRAQRRQQGQGGCLGHGVGRLGLPCPLPPIPSPGGAGRSEGSSWHPGCRNLRHAALSPGFLRRGLLPGAGRLGGAPIPTWALGQPGGHLGVQSQPPPFGLDCGGGGAGQGSSIYFYRSFPPSRSLTNQLLQAQGAGGGVQREAARPAPELPVLRWLSWGSPRGSLALGCCSSWCRAGSNPA